MNQQLYIAGKWTDAAATAGRLPAYRRAGWFNLVTGLPVDVTWTVLYAGRCHIDRQTGHRPADRTRPA